jgi:hypothetical protein
MTIIYITLGLIVAAAALYFYAIKTGKIKDADGDLIADKAEDVAKEVKRRAKNVKAELADVKKAAKELADQAEDVVEAAKGKPRKGRPASKGSGKGAGTKPKRASKGSSKGAGKSKAKK